MNPLNPDISRPVEHGAPVLAMGALLERALLRRVRVRALRAVAAPRPADLANPPLGILLPAVKALVSVAAASAASAAASATSAECTPARGRRGLSQKPDKCRRQEISSGYIRQEIRLTNPTGAGRRSWWG